MNSGSTTHPLHIRPLLPADLPELLRIQAACYGAGFLEGADRFAARLAVAPHSSWLACGTDGFARGYLVAYPTVRGAITPLNAVFRPAAQPDTLYLHDLAVHPDAAGLGLGPQLVHTALAWAAEHHLTHSALVAVQGSLPFWRRLGYAASAPAPGAADALASYGSGAHYLVCELARRLVRDGVPGSAR